MTQAAAATRTFSVHARHVPAHDARILEELSFEAAATAYVEDLHELPGEGRLRSGSLFARWKAATSTASRSISTAAIAPPVPKRTI